MKTSRHRRELVEHAVDPEPDLARVLERLEVDVAGPGAERLVQDLIDHADDPAVAARRRWQVEVEDVLVVLVLLVFLVGSICSKSSVPAMNPSEVCSVEEAVEPALDDRQRRDHGLDPQPGQELDLVDDQHLLGGDERQLEPLARTASGTMSWSRHSFSGRSRASSGGGIPRRFSAADQGKHKVLGIGMRDLLVRGQPRLDRARTPSAHRPRRTSRSFF